MEVTSKKIFLFFQDLVGRDCNEVKRRREMTVNSFDILQISSHKSRVIKNWKIFKIQKKENFISSDQSSDFMPTLNILIVEHCIIMIENCKRSHS